jgi:hypothetical protein
MVPKNSYSLVPGLFLDGFYGSLPSSEGLKVKGHRGHRIVIKYFVVVIPAFF